MENKKTSLAMQKLFVLNKNSLKAILMVLIYRFLLDISYYYAISPTYTYAGMITDINIIKLIESYFALIILLVSLPKQNEKVSYMILQIFMLVGYIPILTYYSLANQSRTWFYLATLFWLFVILLNKLKIAFGFKSLREGRYFNWIMVIVLTCISIGLLQLYVGLSFNLNNFNLLNIYERRAVISQINIPFGGYIINWTAKIILPFIILYSSYANPHKKMFLMFLLSVCCELILFLTMGHKSYLFMIPAALGLAWLIGKGNFLIRISFVFTCIIGIGILLYWAIDDISYSSIIIRRVFLVPVQLSFYYYDFFRDNSIYLSHSIFKYFIHYPFDLDPSHMIGAVYLNNPECSANNGIVADGFMNFGYLGLLLWAVLLAGLLKVADSLVKSKNTRVFYPLIILSFYTMINGALLTTILTHGLFLVFIIAYFSEKDKKQWKLEKSAI